MRIAIVILILLIHSSEGITQSSFGLNYLSTKPTVVAIKYDGRLSSVADSEVVKLSPFQFLSIGKLKEMSAVANGCISVVFVYRHKQYIIVESRRERSYLPNATEWIPIEKGDQNKYGPGQNFTTKKNKQSFILDLENVRISIVNIKADKVKLFRFLGSTFEFDG